VILDFGFAICDWQAGLQSRRESTSIPAPPIPAGLLFVVLLRFEFFNRESQIQNRKLG
jgi:hypothetical protein